MYPRNNTQKIDYFNEKIDWSQGTDANHPYLVTFGNAKLQIRLNDPLETYAYTLLIGEKEIKSFDEWPKNWIKPEKSAGFKAKL